jgi:hypothetical protein
MVVDIADLAALAPPKKSEVGEPTLREFDTNVESEAGWLAGFIHLPGVALFWCPLAGRR